VRGFIFVLVVQVDKAWQDIRGGKRVASELANAFFMPTYPKPTAIIGTLTDGFKPPFHLSLFIFQFIGPYPGIFLCGYNASSQSILIIMLRPRPGEFVSLLRLCLILVLLLLLQGYGGAQFYIVVQPVRVWDRAVCERMMKQGAGSRHFRAIPPCIHQTLSVTSILAKFRLSEC